MNTTFNDSEGKEIQAIDMIEEENNIFHSEAYSLKKDIYEQLIKDTVYKLIGLKKICRVDGEILLHSHGIDEFFPKKTAKEIGRIYNIDNTKVRSIRWIVAQKVAKAIRTQDKPIIKRNHVKEVRKESRITFRITEEQLNRLNVLCQTKGQNIGSTMRNILALYLRYH